MKKSAALPLSHCALALSVPAAAQFATAEDAIKYRQSGLFIMRQNFVRRAAMVSGRLRLTQRWLPNAWIHCRWDYLQSLP